MQNHTESPTYRINKRSMQLNILVYIVTPLKSHLNFSPCQFTRFLRITWKYFLYISTIYSISAY